ncbi:MAG TPA: SRPBCC family protein [Mycobacteriales bacterium]|jgi:carbon monoxide dehydrogenase subunit G|nr:SRPBCC family protein [Mycobacteriales bacterium]
MKLENRFTVPVTADVAWQVLLDVERIAPCMPGATLTGQDGDSFTGTVKVKVGPINLTYGGKASFRSKDEAARVAVIEATGKETRGTGTAKATITARLHERDGATEVQVETDLAVTGKPAQFGRGVLADVSGKLVDQFAACLAEEISPKAPQAAQVPTEEPAGTGFPDGANPNGSAGPSGAGSASAPAAGPGAAAPPITAAAPRRPAEPIDLLGTAGMPVLKRLAPALAGLAGVFALIAVWRRRR